MTTTRRSFPFRRHALAVALTLVTGAVNATTINVSGACTLINAINNANSDADTDGAGRCPAGSGADILNLKAHATYTLTAINNTTNGENGLPVISSTITINGNGATIERSSNAPSFRLFHIAASGNLTIDTVKLTGGSSPGEGGGMLNQGNTTLINSIVSGNNAHASGGINNTGSMTLTNSTVSDNESLSIGGIYNNGKMTLLNSTVSNNSDYSTTGGINNNGEMTLTNSTVSGNYVNFGGGSGITNDGSMTLTKSSVSGNSGDFSYAINNHGNISLTNCNISDNIARIGIANSGNVKLANSTVSGNYTEYLGGYGGGIDGGRITLTNSLITNKAGKNLSGDCSGVAVILQGVNFIGDGGCGAPLSGDPLLSALLNNGGITLTKALQTGSPAINAADSNLCPKTDQRNVSRPLPKFSVCDIGAFERTKGIPASVTGIVQFFDTQVANGGVTGTGSGDLAPQQLDALRNQLLTAGDYKVRNLAIQACSQLTRTLGYIDTDNMPEADDYVTGAEAGTLADEVTDLRASWLCK